MESLRKKFLLHKEKKEFYTTRPDVYIVVNKTGLDFISENGDYCEKFFSVCKKLSAEGAFFILVLKIFKGELSEKGEFLKSFIKRLYENIRLTELWLFSDFVFSYPEMVNEIVASILYSSFLLFRRISGNVLCFFPQEVSELLKKFNITNDFSITLYINTFSVPFEEFFRYVIDVKKSGLRMYVDFHKDLIFNGNIDNFLVELQKLLEVYSKYVESGSIKIYTLDHFIREKAPGCFTGDCIKNTLTLSISGNVYLCVKDLLCYEEGRTLPLGNIYKIPISSFDEEIFVNPERLKLKKKQITSRCQCYYWNLCHGICNLYDLNPSKCKDFFLYLERSTPDLKQKLSFENPLQRFVRGFYSLKEWH